MLRIEMRWHKSDDTGAPELQFRYEFKYSDGEVDWTDWETVRVELKRRYHETNH